jgi:hypothetical protein
MILDEITEADGWLNLSTFTDIVDLFFYYPMHPKKGIKNLSSNLTYVMSSHTRGFFDDAAIKL